MQTAKTDQIGRTPRLTESSLDAKPKLIALLCSCSYLFVRQVIPVLLHLIQAISAVRLYLPQDLRPLDNRQSVGKSIQVRYRLFLTAGLSSLAN